jgi:hypothetical protein
MRTEPVQLPNYDELYAILSHEDSREIPNTKKHIHYVDFSTILALLKEYKLSIEFFDLNFKFSDFRDGALFSEAVLMFTDLVDNILQTQDDEQKQKLFNNLYDYLSESDSEQKVDIIFVFGSKSTFRIEKAIRLYEAGYAPKILISGKGPFYEKDNESVPEAQKLAEYALERGVPESALILEKESITVSDNVRRSLNMLERQSIPRDSFILVNSPFSQRRGWAHFSKFSVEGTKIIRSNVDTMSDQYSKDGWYRNEIGAKTIVKEFFALRMSEILNTS